MKRLLVVIATFATVSAVPFAQQASTSAQSQPMFRAGVEYVELDAVVTDKNDRPVLNLTKDDFAITEHGSRQTIATFQFASFPPTHRTVVDVKTTAPTVDVATNAHPAMGRQWVLLVDDLHLFEQNIVQTKRVIQTFLESISPDDQVAVVFSGHSNLSLDFTSDLGSLMQTVNRLREALGFAEDTPGSMHPVTRANCGVRSQNARSTLDVVRNVTVSLMHSTYPRKAMVFISNGFDYVLTEPSVDLRTLARGDGPLTACPNEDINAKEILFTLTELFQKARVSGVPVYTVPPTGLMAPEDTTRHGIPDGKAFRAETDFMHVVAENTGGRAFVGRSDMIGAMHELVDDNSSFYLLGYYPEPAVRDGKWHDVKISLVGHPEYHIRAKEGYTASAAAATAAAAASHTLEDALGAALPSGELVLRAFAAPVAATPHGMKVVVTVEVTEPAPPLGSKLDDQLQFGLVAIDHDGAIKANVRRAFHFIATPTASGDVAYVVNEIVDLPSQPLILRVAIASQALGKVGTIHVPLVVPDTHGGNLQIGGIVLGLVDAPREGALETVPIATLVPFQPTTTRTFAATDTLRVFDRLFWGSKDADADVTITVVGAASRAPLAVHVAGAPATANPSKREGTLATLVPLAGLAHGEYTLRIEARIANGQTARRDVLFAMK